MLVFLIPIGLGTIDEQAKRNHKAKISIENSFVFPVWFFVEASFVKRKVCTTCLIGPATLDHYTVTAQMPQLKHHTNNKLSSDHMVLLQTFHALI